MEYKRETSLYRYLCTRNRFNLLKRVATHSVDQTKFTNKYNFINSGKRIALITIFTRRSEDSPENGQR